MTRHEGKKKRKSRRSLLGGGSWSAAQGTEVGKGELLNQLGRKNVKGEGGKRGWASRGKQRQVIYKVRRPGEKKLRPKPGSESGDCSKSEDAAERNSDPGVRGNLVQPFKGREMGGYSRHNSASKNLKSHHE